MQDSSDFRFLICRKNAYDLSLPTYFLHALRQPPHAFFNLLWSQSAERKANESLSAAVREEREAIRQIQISLRSSCSHIGSGCPFRQREREKESALRLRGLCIRHVPLERG